jgi:pentatricopeptide repeat protein
MGGVGNFIYFPKERCKMATMVMEPTTRARQIKTAISSLGKDEWTEKLLDMLDEMELERNIAISLEEAKKGLGRPVDDVVDDLIRKIENGN